MNMILLQTWPNLFLKSLIFIESKINLWPINGTWAKKDTNMYTFVEKRGYRIS